MTKETRARAKSKAYIEYAIRDDFEQIYPLLQQFWPDRELHEDTLADIFDRGIGSDITVYLCAKRRNKIIGFCSISFRDSLWQEGDIAYVHELVVDESERGQGVGSALLDEAIEVARSRKCKRIELDSGLHREEAHAFYEKAGFEKRAALFSKILSGGRDSR